MNENGRKVVWITGASSGIGEHVARRLARRGATVVGTARNADHLDAIAAETPRFEPAPGDVTDRDGLRRIAAEIRDRRGRIDLAVFSAGYWQQMPIDEYDAATVQRHLEVNTMGVANGIDAVLPAMLARGQGTIAGVASVAGYRGMPGAAGYGASKAATINLLESVRIEAAPRGVKVVTVNPGFVDTKLTRRNDFRMPFMIDSDSAAKSIVRGLERGRSEIVFPAPMAAFAKVDRLLPVAAHAALFRPRGRDDA